MACFVVISVVYWHLRCVMNAHVAWTLVTESNEHSKLIEYVKDCEMTFNNQSIYRLSLKTQQQTSAIDISIEKDIQCYMFVPYKKSYHDYH